MLLLWPISGSISLTLVLIAFFIIEGIASIMYAIEHRNQATGQWLWMLVSGIIDLILAGIIFAGLPGHCVLGAWPACRHQHGVRRRGLDSDGDGGPTPGIGVGIIGGSGRRSSKVNSVIAGFTPQ